MMLINQCEAGKIYRMKTHIGTENSHFVFICDKVDFDGIRGTDIWDSNSKAKPSLGWAMRNNDYNGCYELTEVHRAEHPEYFL